MSKKIILIRHAESVWNLENKFAGWADISLTKTGIEESVRTGIILKNNNLIPKIGFTSIQKRSIDTAKIILNQMNLGKISLNQDWRLNERHYGKLTGHFRENIKWKGGYFDVPPNMKNLDNLNIVNVENYNPEYGESYYMTFLRIYPFWKSIVPLILDNKLPLICAHKNSLKVIIKHIEGIEEKDINKIEVPNCVPIIYYFDDDMNYINKIILK